MKGRLLKTNYCQSALEIVNDRAVRILRLTLRLAFSLIVILPIMEFTANVAAAQSTETDVSSQLIGKPLYLRGFWAEDKLAFDAAGQPLKHYSPISFTESGFDAFKVKIRGDRMTIEGQRVGLTFDKSGNYKRLGLTVGNGLWTKPEQITLEINGNGNRDFSKALDEIFARSLEELAPSLPSFWQTYARKHLVAEPASLVADVAEHPTVPKETVRVMHVGGSVIPPKPIKTPDPGFSVAARRMKYSGKVEVYLWAEPDGSCSHVSIARPAGLGLDEQAVATVSQYKFSPATQNGKPVRVELYVEVNFQIF